MGLLLNRFVFDNSHPVPVPLFHRLVLVGFEGRFSLGCVRKAVLSVHMSSQVEALAGASSYSSIMGLGSF